MSYSHLTSILTFIVDTTDPIAELGFEAWLDDKKCYDIAHVGKTHLGHRLEYQLYVPWTDGDHELRFIMKNKTQAHTQIDGDGNIIKDASIIIDDLVFDGVKLGHILTEYAVYTHNQNIQFCPTVTDKFYGEMGYNGTVTFKFSTPICVWLNKIYAEMEILPSFKGYLATGF